MNGQLICRGKKCIEIFKYRWRTWSIKGKFNQERALLLDAKLHKRRVFKNESKQTYQYILHIMMW